MSEPAAEAHKRARPQPRPSAIGDERLIEALAASGCPLCRHLRRAGRDELGSILSERITDPAFRQRLVGGGGLCSHHTREAAHLDRRHSGDRTGAAALFRSILTARREQLRHTGRKRGGERSLRESTRGAWACPVCERELRALRDAVDSLARHAAEDETWLVAVFDAPWCLEHLAPLTEWLAPDLRERFVARQVERVADIERRLDGFVHHSSADRRSQQTDPERASVAEASSLLGGDGD